MNQNKQSINEKIACNFDQISLSGIAFLSIISLFACVIACNSGNPAYIQSIFWKITSVILVLYVSFFIYCAYRVIPKLKNFSSYAKYNMLKTYSIQKKLFFSSLIGSIACVIPCSIIMQYGLIQNATLLYYVSSFPQLLWLLSFFGLLTFLDTDSWNESVRIDLNLIVIQDFETIASDGSNKKVKLYTGQIWSYCLKQIVLHLENRFQKVMGTSKNFNKHFYELFNTLSIAALSGNKAEQEKAITWIKQLHIIRTDIEHSECTKNRLIIEHLEKLKEDKDFEIFAKNQNDFGFHYDFLSGTERLTKKWEKLSIYLQIIIGIVPLIVAVITYLMSRP